MPPVHGRHSKVGTHEKHVWTQKILSFNNGAMAVPSVHVQKYAMLGSAISDHCWKRQEAFPLSSWFQAAASQIPQLHGPWLRLWPSPDWVASTSTDKQMMQASSGLYPLKHVRLMCVVCVCVSLCLCVIMSPKTWTMLQETLIRQGAYRQFSNLLTLSSTAYSRRPRYLSLPKTLEVGPMIGCATTGGKQVSRHPNERFTSCFVPTHLYAH